MKYIVKNFNQYDLYTKNDEKYDTMPIKWTPELKDFYSRLVKKYISTDMIIKW